MRCRKARSCLPAYCSDELAGQRQLALSEHLSTCQECRREEAIYRSLNQATDKLSHGSLSEDFNNKLLNRIASERFAETRSKAYMPNKAPLMAWSRVVPAIATACLAIIVTVTAFQSDGEQPVGSSENRSLAMDDSYLTVQPTHNPNMTARLDRNWSLNDQLAKAERMNRISNRLSIDGSFVGVNSPYSGSRFLSQRLRPIPFASNYYRIRPIIRVYLSPDLSTQKEGNRGY